MKGSRASQRGSARAGRSARPEALAWIPQRGTSGPRRTRSTRRQRPDSPYIPGPWDGREQVRCGAAPPSPGVHLALLPLKRYPRVEPSAPSSFHLTVLSPGPPVLLASPKSEPRTTTRAGAAGTRPVRTRLSLLAFATKGKGPPPIDSGEWPGALPHPPSPHRSGPIDWLWLRRALDGGWFPGTWCRASAAVYLFARRLLLLACLPADASDPSLCSGVLSFLCLTIRWYSVL
jgi:hypothetical protein